MKKLLLILLCLPIIYLVSCSKSGITPQDTTIYGCMDSLALNYDSLANTNDSSCCFILGCTDSSSFNYNFLACYDDSSCVENVYVNEYVDLSLPENSGLITAGNAIFVNGGIKGIIIYHGVGNDYRVYDRICSYEPSLSCSFIDSVSSAVAYCGCCSSAFLLSNNGVAVNAPALLPLKQYNWSLDNNILRIYNIE